MDIIQAKELLSILADGVNPMTGEVLPPEDSCNQADVVRALHAVIGVIESSKPKARPQNAGSPWSEIEENALLKEYDSGMTVSSIAKKHGRTKGAIKSRLAAHGKMDSPFLRRK